VSAPNVEAFLARIYVDAQAREKFLSNPAAEARAAGLSPEEVEAVTQIDQVGLDLFAVSLERKRQRLLNRSYVVADLLKSLLVFATAFVVRPQIVPAVLYQLLTQLLTLRTARPLESQHRKQ
jgi:hypothetical protein